MKEIPLSRGLSAIVDDEDYDWLSQWKWSAHKAWGRFRAVRVTSKPRKTILMHREILGKILQDDPKLETDHINQNSLDNRKSNLRIASKAENAWNRGRLRSQSGYKGVLKCGDKWSASITYNKIKKHLGVFCDPIEAAKVYDKYAKELHGQFARTNF